MTYTDTQIKILNEAEKLIQTNGYNGFSYKDIAALVGIKTSSIHYHYSTKEDLSVAVIDWQLYKLLPTLAAIKNNQRLSIKRKLHNFLDVIFSVTYEDNCKMCLGGMFASDVLLLPKAVQNRIAAFFDTLSEWIESVVDVHFKGINREFFAKQLLMQLEGGLLLARIYKDNTYLHQVKSFVDSKLS